MKMEFLNQSDHLFLRNLSQVRDTAVNELKLCALTYRVLFSEFM